MDVRFREVDPFNCWLWLRFSEVPSQGERNYVDGVFDSWYVIGRLGVSMLKTFRFTMKVLISAGWDTTTKRQSL